MGIVRYVSITGQLLKASAQLAMEADERFGLEMMLLDTRVSKTDSAGTTSYKRVGAYVTNSLLKSTVSSTTTDYTPGVSSRVGSDSTFLHSGIKNADTQTDDGGDVSAMRRYDAFGNPVAAWGGWQDPFGYGGPYGYQTDPDHGLMLLGHRYYESDTGRFLTRDPIKDGRNWYGYCDGNPISSADCDGLRVTWLYRLYDKHGRFLKWGISTNPEKRYPKWKRYRMEIVTWYDDGLGDYKRGKHDPNALHDERLMVREFPGPLNRERWRRSKEAGVLLILSLATADPIGFGENLGPFIDPYVDVAHENLQNLRINRWLGEPDEHTTFLSGRGQWSRN